MLEQPEDRGSRTLWPEKISADKELEEFGAGKPDSVFESIDT
jgi:hypothetical protein